MKKAKKSISLILAILMALTLLPGTARAKRSDTDIPYAVTGGNIYFDAVTGTITDCDYRVTAAEIPSAINGVAVTSIGAWAFAWRSNLASITVPNSVTNIGDWAFGNCSSLASITIPDSVTSIGARAFSDCYSLASITIPDSVTSMGEQAFDHCTGLTSITIPDSVTSIGNGPFRDCDSLTGISVDPENPDYASEDGVLFDKQKSTLICYPGGKSASSYAIPDSVTSIGHLAFAGCDRLTSMTIPDGVTSIGFYAFAWCSNLASITIPDGVTSIGFYAFAWCSNLASITIPDGVTSIGPYTFDYCDSLTDVYYARSESQWEKITIEDGNYPLFSATIHYSSAGPGAPFVPAAPTTPSGEYIYDVPDPGEEMTLPADRLNTVTDSASAAGAVKALTDSMTPEQKQAPTCIDLATLYAETAAAKAASQKIDNGDLLINAALLSSLQSTSTQAISAVEGALTGGGVTAARELSRTVILTTDETSVTIRIDPDILTTDVDKVRVETPGYALTFKLSDLAPDLTQTLTFSAKSAVSDTTAPSTVVSSFSSNADGQAGTISRSILANAAVPAVEIDMSGGKTTNSITVSLPNAGGDTTYQAVASADGAATASKYNPATTMMDGKVNTSGKYTVMTNEKDFTDIASKSKEMQDAIRYLASKGIINGTTATTFSPDGSISRAEIATLLVKALGKLDSTAATSFSDVLKSNWYYTAAASSQRHGLINGYEDNTFRGTNDISKVQIVAVSSRVLSNEMNYKAPSNPEAYLSKYKDTVANWAQSEVALATRENLVVYRTDGTFSGDKNMTRGDAAIIIYRLFQRIW